MNKPNKFKIIMTLISLLLSVFCAYSQSNPILIGKTYTFYDGPQSVLNCSECDPIWDIKFLDKLNAVLISRQANKSSDYGSCKTNLKYKYNETTKTVTIIELNNKNVSSRCLNMFIGDWQWRKGKYYDMRFYSKIHQDCDFSPKLYN
jgi:hypothetical protein